MPEKIKHTIKEVAHRITPAGIITKINPGQIFTFGSNLGGKHSKFAAKIAMSMGAKFGQAAGIQGNTYGIPTKDKSVIKVTFKSVLVMPNPIVTFHCFRKWSIIQYCTVYFYLNIFRDIRIFG